MAWEENPRICLHMQLIAILSRTGVYQWFLFWNSHHKYGSCFSSVSVLLRFFNSIPQIYLSLCTRTYSVQL